MLQEDSVGSSNSGGGGSTSTSTSVDKSISSAARVSGPFELSFQSRLGFLSRRSR